MIKGIRGFVLLMLSVFLGVIACTAAPSSPPLRTATGLWPGNTGHYVAAAKDFFAAEGVTIEHTVFQDQVEGITAFLAGKLDVLWGTSSDAVQIAAEDPSTRIIYLSDYSDGGDGIVGRNITSPSDLKGKTIAREDLLFVKVLLRAYLQQGGLTEADVKLRDMPAAAATAAFIAGHVDAVVSYGPWLAQAVEEGNGELIFSTKGTNLVADTVITRQEQIETRTSDLQAYLRAIHRGVQLIQARDPEAISTVADALGVPPSEAEAQLGTVRFMDLEDNKTIIFDPAHSDSLIANLKLTTEAAYDFKVLPRQLEVESLYDASIVQSL
jgi:NitT/TauT family transport system substrate-binding protein